MIGYVERFLHYLGSVKNASKNTVQSYRHDTLCFLSFAQHHGVANFDQIPSDLAVDYFDELRAQGKSSSTISRNSAALHSFYKYLMQFEGVVNNPFQGVKADKTTRQIPQILTKEEVELLLAQPNLLDCKGLRDRTMLEVLYATGMRISELLELNVEDVNLSVGFIRLHADGVGGNERYMPLYPMAAKFLQQYLTTARGILHSPDSGDALFLNLNGERLSRQGFLENPAQIPAAGANPNQNHPSDSAPLLCSPSAGKRRRFETGAGAARAYRHRLHPVLLPASQNAHAVFLFQVSSPRCRSQTVMRCIRPASGGQDARQKNRKQPSDREAAASRQRAVSIQTNSLSQAQKKPLF